jgi:hypothetical protein
MMQISQVREFKDVTCEYFQAMELIYSRSAVNSIP